MLTPMRVPKVTAISAPLSVLHLRQVQGVATVQTELGLKNFESRHYNIHNTTDVQEKLDFYISLVK